MAGRCRKGSWHADDPDQLVDDMDDSEDSEHEARNDEDSDSKTTHGTIIIQSRRESINI